MVYNTLVKTQLAFNKDKVVNDVSLYKMRGGKNLQSSRVENLMFGLYLNFICILCSFNVGQ